MKNTTLNEFITLAFAILPWFFPNLPFLSKFAIAAILLGILIVSKTNLDISIVSKLLGLRYYIFIPFLLIIVAVLETIIALLFTGINLFEIEKILGFLVIGGSYGLVIGLPMLLFGMNKYDGMTFKKQGIIAGIVQFIIWIISAIITLFIASKSGFVAFSFGSVVGPVFISMFQIETNNFSGCCM